MMNAVNLLLIGAGAWIIADGFISLTYWANVDKTQHNTLAQLVRVVRIAVGSIVLAAGVLV